MAQVKSYEQYIAQLKSSYDNRSKEQIRDALVGLTTIKLNLSQITDLRRYLVDKMEAKTLYTKKPDIDSLIDSLLAKVDPTGKFGLKKPTSMRGMVDLRLAETAISESHKAIEKEEVDLVAEAEAQAGFAAKIATYNDAINAKFDERKRMAMQQFAQTLDMEIIRGNPALSSDASTLAFVQGIASNLAAGRAVNVSWADWTWTKALNIMKMCYNGAISAKNNPQISCFLLLCVYLISGYAVPWLLTKYLAMFGLTEAAILEGLIWMMSGLNGPLPAAASASGINALIAQISSMLARLALYIPTNYLYTSFVFLLGDSNVRSLVASASVGGWNTAVWATAGLWTGGQWAIAGLCNLIIAGLRKAGYLQSLPPMTNVNPQMDLNSLVDQGAPVYASSVDNMNGKIALIPDSKPAEDQKIGGAAVNVGLLDASGNEKPLLKAVEQASPNVSPLNSPAVSVFSSAASSAANSRTSGRMPSSTTPIPRIPPPPSAKLISAVSSSLAPIAQAQAQEIQEVKDRLMQVANYASAPDSVVDAKARQLLQANTLATVISNISAGKLDGGSRSRPKRRTMKLRRNSKKSNKKSYRKKGQYKKASRKTNKKMLKRKMTTMVGYPVNKMATQQMQQAIAQQQMQTQRQRFANTQQSHLNSTMGLY
jgi:hypothetical protein